MNSRLTFRFLRHALISLASATLITVPMQARALLLDLSDLPLEVKEGVPANIVLTMDDSGSMAWGFLPDDRQDEWSNHYRSSTYNLLYYNPKITYTPGVDEYGNSLGNASFTAAWLNGYNQGQGTVDLSTNYGAPYYDYRPSINLWHYHVTDGVADYYVFNDANTDSGGGTCVETDANDIADDNCYDRVIVGTNTAPDTYAPTITGCSPVSESNTACYIPGRYDPDYTNCNPREESNTACYTKDETQNFANWFSYYRLRHLLAKTATSRAFAGLSTSVRVAWQTLNSDTNIGDTLPFGGTHRTNFFNWLSSAPTDGATPLTDAMWRAGTEFTNSGPYRDDPTDSTSPERSCRQNFHFAFTDGYWNNSGTVTPFNVGNYDASTNLNLPTTGSSKYGDINYSATTALASDKTPPIYRDNNTNFLGDIAFYFWATDLRSLTNNVPHFIDKSTTTVDLDGDGDVDNYDIFWNPLNDPAEWQHMVNFTVGLGIDGVLPYNSTTYNQLLQGPAGGGLDWPTSGTNGTDNHHVDDLWHAAINSRGRYFSASNPTELLEGFQNVLDAIDERKGSSTALATTSSQYQAGTWLFQAIYDTNDWSGDIKALDVISLNQQWSAAQRLADQIANNNPGRVILSADSSGNGIAFQWSALSADQQNLLNTLNGTTDGLGQQRLAYLRGDSSNEKQNGGTFRNRDSYLGDVVHSDPVFVPPPGPPRFYYPDTLEADPYSTFVSSNSGRTNMLVFGANDGMVHVLDANDGTELLAYVPGPVYKNLSKLTDVGYQHQFYVNQPITVWDVYINNAWRTVAIGGLGKGGQGLFALDLTNPSNFNETNANSLVLWEFTDADDADLGYTYTKPYVMRMNNGEWMVAFGNGYNADEADGNASTTGDAILFLIDIATGGDTTGGLKVKLSTETGINEDPTGLGRANRLSDVTAIDVDGNLTVDYIYAGDLFGNLWKFDVSDSNPANWSVMGTASGPAPLFTAKDPNGNVQPITTAPAIQYHRQKRGYLIYFGTGKYVENNDPADTNLQTFYAVWDRLETSITTIERQYLLQQKIEGVNTTQFTETDARLTSNEIMNWYNGGGLPPGASPTEYLGWYLDLVEYDTNGNPILTGERIDGDIYVFGNRVEFQTLIPSTDPCVSGGTSWLFALNATTGSRFLTASPWDYNNNGTFDSLDKVNFGAGQIWGSGIRLKSGGLFRRTKLLTPGECQEVNILNMADGSLGTVTGNCTTNDVGRRSWRQIFIH